MKDSFVKFFYLDETDSFVKFFYLDETDSFVKFFYLDETEFRLIHLLSSNKWYCTELGTILKFSTTSVSFV